MRPPAIDALNDHGVAVLMAIMYLLLFSMAAAFAISVGYQQKLTTETVVGGRVKDYYFARAGMVDAFERLRNKSTPPGSACGLSVDACDPPVYYINLGTDTAHAAPSVAGDNVSVDISAVDGTTKLRTVLCKSIGT